MLFGQAGAALATMLSYMFIASALGAEAFGKWAAIQAVVLVLIQFFTFNTGKAFIHYAERLKQTDYADYFQHKLARLCFLLDLTSSLLACLSAYFLIPYLPHWLEIKAEEVFYAQLYALTAIGTLSHLPIAILQFYQKFSKVAWFIALNSGLRLISLVVCFFLLPKEDHFSGFLLVWAVFEVFIPIIFLISASHFIPKHKKYLSYSVLEKCPNFFGFIIKTSLNAFVRLFPKDGDILLTGLLLGPAAAGILRIIKQLSSIVMRIIDPFTQAFFPEINKLVVQKQLNDLRKLNRTTLKYCIIISLFFWLGFTIFGYPILLLIGEDYTQSYIALVIFTAGASVMTLSAPLSPLGLALGIPGKLLINQTIAVLAYILSIFWLHSLLQLNGISISYLIFSITWTSLMFFTVFKKLSLWSPSQ
ncbi:lipopolysaccharide biosynthesis protein [Terasakiella sp. SH-1]|uniref:lipopolysaccharide biosynthesis protein n=1 Tax=Terasakiella sp. SH-1 TaxID=2560057 RepID=UPI001073251A|nr:lipopolysaccharide biosynthesis protein [Terasakiella sp. SH-1]